MRSQVCVEMESAYESAMRDYHYYRNALAGATAANDPSAQAEIMHFLLDAMDEALHYQVVMEFEGCFPDP